MTPLGEGAELPGNGCMLWLESVDWSALLLCGDFILKEACRGAGPPRIPAPDLLLVPPCCMAPGTGCEGPLPGIGWEGLAKRPPMTLWPAGGPLGGSCLWMPCTPERFSRLRRGCCIFPRIPPVMECEDRSTEGRLFGLPP